MLLQLQEISTINKIEIDSFKTIPNSLRQLPGRNLIIPETPLGAKMFIETTIMKKILSHKGKKR
jgi:hypothetical protein